jgi:hypothetical protein
LSALPGDEVDFDLPGGHVQSVAIPKGTKPDEMITIKVGNETGKGAKAGAVGEVSKKRWASLWPATAFQDPRRRHD